MIKFIVLVCVFFVNSCFSQLDEKIKYYYNSINSSYLAENLSIIASDSFLGRATGKAGQLKAASFLANYYSIHAINFPASMNSYFQDYSLMEFTKSGSLSIDKNQVNYLSDYLIVDCKFTFNINNIPVYYLEQLPFVSKDSCFVIVNIDHSDVVSQIERIKPSLPKFVNGLIVLSNSFKDLAPYLNTKSRISMLSKQQNLEFPILIMDYNKNTTFQSDSTTWFLKKKTLKKKHRTTPIFHINGVLNNENKLLSASNVLAFIPGEDSILSKEVIVLSAHYDHLGVIDGEIYNGADDDGTGTVALMEIARVFNEAKNKGYGSKRSLLFIHFSGEEIGLYGSTYYSNNPVYPLSSTIANLNIDMIGRSDDFHKADSNYIYIIGSNMLSTDLHNANEDANKEVKLFLDYKYNDKNDPNQFYYRSDHYNFAKNNIPSIFYFSGVHEDYHKPTDDVEKIMIPLLRKRTQLVFLTAWNLANAKTRPLLNH